MRGDAKKQAETLEIKRRNGIVNSNEWRALDNDAPLLAIRASTTFFQVCFGRLDLIQGPGNKNEQKPDQSNQDNSAKAQPAKSEQQLPAFDAKVLAETIQQSNLLKPEGNQSRGGSVADVDSIAREMVRKCLQKQWSESVQ